jgi:transposase
MNNFYLGADASKGYADFVILNDNKQVVKQNFQLDDTFEGHHKLYEILATFFQHHPDCMLYAALESTGGYENNWLYFLADLSSCFNIQVARLNPFGVNKNSQASMKRNKTDKISARDIAEYLISHAENVSYQTYDPLAPLKEQWNYINLLTKQKVQLLNVLEKSIYKANPELLIYCKNGVPRWVLKLLQQFPTAPCLAETTAEQLATISYISLKKARTLIKRAQHTVASTNDPIIADRIQHQATEIVSKDNDINKQKKLLQQNVKVVPEKIQLLRTFKGIGIYSAVGLLIVIGDVNNFSTAKKLACYFGVHPVHKQSGDGSWNWRMSKKGSAVARQILFMVTFSAIRHNPLIKEIYANCQKRGMKKMAAIGLCMHKILRIVYGILKHNKPFDPEIDRQNQQRQLAKFPQISKNYTRRHQGYDSAAPISRRQDKKRKQQLQANNIDFVTINSDNFVPDLSDISLN